MKFNLICLALLTIYSIQIEAVMVTGNIQATEKLSDFQTRRKRIVWASEKLPYVSGIGGIVFTYPTNYFAATPNVTITLEAAVPTTAGDVFSTWIVSNSATSTQAIATHTDSSGVVTEVPSGAVNVILYALGDPIP